MAMKHPRRYHKKAAANRRKLVKAKKEAKRATREKLAAAQQTA